MPSPLLFHGENSETLINHLRKRALAQLDLQTVTQLNNCPDYLELAPTSKSFMYSVDIIDTIINQCFLPPYTRKKRVIAITSMERMLPVHANALLKTLEEAPGYCHIYLTTTRKGRILKTLLSRMQKEFIPQEGEGLDCRNEIENIALSLHQKKYDLFNKLIEKLEKQLTEESQLTEARLKVFQEQLRSFFLEKNPKKNLQPYFARKIDTLIKKTFDGFLVNVKVKHLLEYLFLEIQPLFHNNQ